MRLSLGKSQRIKSRDLTKTLFASGQKLSTYPVLVFYLDHPETKVMFSVSKRKFRRAVDRNEIKRSLREAYRVHQYELKESKAICFVYVGKSKSDLVKVSKAIPSLLSQLNNQDNHAD